jgi:MOSC domain-containing protein YiiM
MRGMTASAGRVVSLQIVPGNHATAEFRDVVSAVEGKGIEGDWHFHRRDRAVLLMDQADLRDLDVRPGDLREQITLDLDGLMLLPPGTRLRLGEVTLELTKVCEPCTHIGEHVGVDDVESFRDRLRGRRGMLARVTSVEGGGRIRVGDRVEVERPVAAPPAAG